MKYSIDRIRNIFRGQDPNPYALDNLIKYWIGPSHKEREYIIQQCKPQEAFSLLGIRATHEISNVVIQACKESFAAASVENIPSQHFFVLTNSKNMHLLHPALIQDAILKNETTNTFESKIYEPLFWDNLRHVDINDLKTYILGNHIEVFRSYARYCDTDHQTLNGIVKYGQTFLETDSIFRKTLQQRIAMKAFEHGNYRDDQLKNYMKYADNLPEMVATAITYYGNQLVYYTAFAHIQDFFELTYPMLKTDQERNEYRSLLHYVIEQFKALQAKKNFGWSPPRYSVIPTGPQDSVLNFILETAPSNAAAYLRENTSQDMLDIHELASATESLFS